MPQFITTLFGAVVTARIWSSDSLFSSLIKWLKLADGHDSKKMSCLFRLLFFQMSFLCGSNKTEDGLSLPDTLYSTGDILNFGYIDKKSKYLVSSLSLLSILFHTAI